MWATMRRRGLPALGVSLLIALMSTILFTVPFALGLAPILIVQDVVSVWAYRYTWDMRNVVLLVLGGLSGVITGYLLAAKVSDSAIALAVGVISVVFAIRRLVLEGGSVVAWSPTRGAARP